MTSIRADGADQIHADHVEDRQGHRDRGFRDRQHLGDLRLTAEAAVHQLAREEGLFDIGQIAPCHVFGNLRAQGLVIAHRGDQGPDLADLVGIADRHQPAITIDQKIAIGIARITAHEDRHGLTVLLDGVAQIVEAGIVETVANAVADVDL